MARNSIFISYSSLDKRWLTEVKKHLSILELSHQFVIWDDTKIDAGSKWKHEIEQSIKYCRVAILLVSNNFLSSEFIVKKELPEILNAAKTDGITIFNIIIDTCAFHLTGLVVYQCLNNPKFPLEELRSADRKKVLVNLTTQLSEVIAQKKLISFAGETEIPGEEADMFCALLILANLKNNGPQSITEIQHTLQLKRKLIVAVLNTLQDKSYIEKFHGQLENKRPSTLWKVSEFGCTTYNDFERVYRKILNQTT